MPQVARSLRLLQKAEAALVSAIEVYNRPTFAYREETFAILALNAWELLLKAKLLAEHGNKPRCLYVYERRTTRRGTQSTKQYLRRNRSGNAYTIGLSRVLTELENRTPVRIPLPVKANLDALVEIRDNAVHFIVASPQLSKQVLEVGTASVRNFIELARTWFEHDLSGQHFFLMPIAFLDVPGAGTAVPLSRDESKLIAYLASLTTGSAGRSTDYHVALEVNLSFRRTHAPEAMALVLTDDPTAPRVALSEEDFKKIYKWDYRELTTRLKKRYLDFKQDRKFHAIRKPLLTDPRYAKSRYLDPDNPKSSKKDFYAPSVLNEFDKHYAKPPATP